MKKLFIYSLLLLSAAISCTKDLKEQNIVSGAGVPFEISAIPQTKTVNDGLSTNWAAADEINVFHAEAGTTTYTSDGAFSVAAEDITTGRFTGTLASSLDNLKSYDWYVMYPYSSRLTSPVNNNEFYATIGSKWNEVQTQDGDASMAHIAGENYPLYGKVTNIAAVAPVSISMSHLSSLLEINVTNTFSEAIAVNQIQFSTPSEPIIGTYYIKYAAEPITYVSSGDTYVSNTATLDVSNVTVAPNAVGKFYMAIKPFTAKANDVLTVKITTDKGFDTQEISLTKDVTFTAGKIKKVNAEYVGQVAMAETWTLVDPSSELKDGEYVILAHPKDDATKFGYLPNATTSSAPAFKEQTVFDCTTPSYSVVVSAPMIWNFAKNTDGTYSLKNAAGSYLYGINTNNGIRVGSTKQDWKISTHLKNNKAFSFSFAATESSTRYLGVYNGADWRCYTSLTATNFGENGESSQIFLYHKGSASTEPAISCVETIGVAARGESAGELSYEILNPIEGTTLSYTCDGTVVTEVTEGVNPNTVLYTVSANKTTVAREGTITLTYGGVNKVIKVSQATPVFTAARTEVTLGSTEGAETTVTITSDFDWIAEALHMDGITAATGYTINPDTFTWSESSEGKQSIKIKSTQANAAETGTATLGKVVITNIETNQILEIAVKQESSYVAPLTGTTVGKTIYEMLGSPTSYTSGTLYQTLELDENITLTASGGNTGKVYGNIPDLQWRIYQSGGGYFTIDAAPNHIIKSVKVIYSISNAGILKYNGNNVKSNSKLELNNLTSVRLEAGNEGTATNGQVRITSIEVTYE